MDLLTIVTAIATYCSTPVYINGTDYPWNDHDMKMYERNKSRCGEGRYSDTPCVSYFRKVGERDYHLVCKEGRTK